MTALDTSLKVKIYYFRELKGIPTYCACGQKFNPTHALDCKKGGFEHKRHDSIRDILVQLLSKIKNDVGTETHLPPITDENAARASVHSSEGARLEIRARGFWQAG